MARIIRRTLKGACLVIGFSGLLVAQDAQKKMPQTTTARIKGSSSVTTEKLHGTVAYVDGNTLVVKMASGDIRSFTPPESRRFLIDGKELSVHDLKPGTKLAATVTKTETPVTERTTTVGEGKVWYVAGPNVILTLPNGENRQYKVSDDYRFIIGGKKATVFELRKGMVVRAEKIVETPHVELAQDVAVTGSAPPARAPRRLRLPRLRWQLLRPGAAGDSKGRACPGGYAGSVRRAGDACSKDAAQDGQSFPAHRVRRPGLSGNVDDDSQAA